jgi:hypothetical protein
MKQSIPVLLSLAILLLLAPGCDDHDHGAGSTTAPTGSHGHGHDHGHDHAGPKETLGRTDVGGYEVVAVQNGKFAPGGEVNFDVEILGPAKPKAVRFWIGPADGVGTAPKPADEVKDDVYHVDIDVPSDAAAGAKLWVQIEPATGEAVKASFDLK